MGQALETRWPQETIDDRMESGTLGLLLAPPRCERTLQVAPPALAPAQRRVGPEFDALLHSTFRRVSKG